MTIIPVAADSPAELKRKLAGQLASLPADRVLGVASDPPVFRPHLRPLAVARIFVAER